MVDGGGGVGSCGRTLPVIVAEICVQRVQIETHSHGGAQQLRDHLCKPEWETETTGIRSPLLCQVSLSLCVVIVLSIQPLGSTALHATKQGIPHGMQSVSKCAIFPLTRSVDRRVRG